jgi:hypothetical protein
MFEIGEKDNDKVRREITPKTMGRVSFPLLFMDKFIEEYVSES